MSSILEHLTKTFSMVSHKTYNLNANEGFVMFLTPSQLHALLTVSLWKGNPNQLLITQWKWILSLSLLDFGPWQWSALDMGYMDKQPSKIQQLGHGWQAKVGGPGLGSYGAAPARRHDKCNVRRVFSKRPMFLSCSIKCKPICMAKLAYIHRSPFSSLVGDQRFWWLLPESQGAMRSFPFVC